MKRYERMSKEDIIALFTDNTWTLSEFKLKYGVFNVHDYLYEEVEVEADTCQGCAFENYEIWEMPCRDCKRSRKDYWRREAK